MEQKKVYHFKDLGKLKESKDIEELVVVNENLGMRDKQVVIERSLRLGIKVLTVPPVGNWLSGRLDRKQVKKLRRADLLQRQPIRMHQSAGGKDIHGTRVRETGRAGPTAGGNVRAGVS